MIQIFDFTGRRISGEKNHEQYFVQNTFLDYWSNSPDFSIFVSDSNQNGPLEDSFPPKQNGIITSCYSLTKIIKKLSCHFLYLRSNII